MRKWLSKLYHKLLVIVHLSPLSLAEKCRFAFGAAVVFVLSIALFLPYIWMSQLTKKNLLDSARSATDVLQYQHFQLNDRTDTSLPLLSSAGAAVDAEQKQLQWFRFGKDESWMDQGLNKKQLKTIDSIKNNEKINDSIYFENVDDQIYINYIKVIKADDTCISCHNPQGSARPFSQNQPIGAAVIKKTASHLKKTMFINKVWIIIAGLISGTGAIVAFYMITQRVILRPIRQLRALANNVAEGNLDVRSSIKTRDEYEKLAESFNKMLDGLQAGQKKLREANTQLDTKIAELSERNIELYKANKLKGEFLANISHEFRTPLNAILGFAEILREKPIILSKEKGIRYAENIITSGQRLLNMINDLLDMAKTEAGKMEVRIEKTSIDQLCKSVIASFSSLTRKKKIKVKFVAEPDIPGLLTDSGKVQQILYNFLSNAIKFTPEKGRIEINANMIDEKHLRIAVTDNGCGIAEEDKEKIFEKFRQVDGSITRGSTGSGLGLAISKELAAMLAGSIGMKSQFGQGATFWLDLPVNLTQNPEQDQNQTNS